MFLNECLLRSTATECVLTQLKSQRNFRIMISDWFTRRMRQAKTPTFILRCKKGQMICGNSKQEPSQRFVLTYIPHRRKRRRKKSQRKRKPKSPRKMTSSFKMQVNLKQRMTMNQTGKRMTLRSRKCRYRLI